jgi:hypothetical protein
MRRGALLTVALALVFAATAAASPYSYLTVSHKAPGAGAVATLDVTPPRHVPRPKPSRNTSRIGLRLVRGTTVDPSAVAGRCKPAQAADRACPARSRIGWGRADMTGAPRGPYAAEIDLYLGPARSSGDIASVVLIASAAGRSSNTTGRIFPLDEQVSPQYGVQVSFNHLRQAFGVQANTKGRLEHLNVHLGAHRTVAGERHDLLRNPSSCDPDGWPWRIEVGGNLYYGEVHCSA